MAMLTAVKGYYDGNQIVMDESDKKNLNIGDEVIITILDNINIQKTDTRAVQRKKIVESEDYIVPTGRTVEEIDNYVNELRTNDRL